MLIVLFSYALVRHAHTRPGYDPYGWLTWGYHTLHGDLDLGGAPSWKPLPYLFTVPLALFGHHQLALWMTIETAITLSGSLFAGRIAYRLVLPPDHSGPDRYRRGAAIAAALFAGFGLFGLQTWVHLFLSAQSDTMITALCLGAVDMHLCGRCRWAFAFLVLAALGRPETWPFTGLYFLWAWRARPRMRWFLGAGLALIPLLWFGVPTITNDRPLVSAELAELSARRIMGNKFVGVFDRYTALTCLAIQLLALVAVVWGYFRRNRTVLLLAGAAVLWMLVETAFVLHGWPGVPRYMIESAAIQTVLAAVAFGWILTDLPRVRIRRRAGAVPRWVGLPIAALIGVALVPAAVARVNEEHTDLVHEHRRTVEITRLHATVAHLGGSNRVRACAKPATYTGFASILAYETHMNVGQVGYRPEHDIRRGYRILLFHVGPHGWSVRPYNVPAAARAACAGMYASIVFTDRHPNGLVIRRRG